MKSKGKTKGIIAAGHPQTASAATRIFEEGGNAFDAAVAALFTTFVTESCMSSVGGGGFANLVTANGDQQIIDFFCQTPKHKRLPNDIEFYPITIDLGDTKEDFHIGNGSSAVPGAIAGIYALHEQLCTLPLKILVEPAIEAAKTGAYIDDFQAFDFQILKSILEINELAQPIWFKDGQLLQEGDHLYMPQFADFLEHLILEGQALFYKGEIARKVSEVHQQSGGQLTRQDFEAYQVYHKSPITVPYGQKTILCNPAPSIGGALMALSMQQLDGKFTNYHYQDSQHVQTLYDIYTYCNQLHSNPALLQSALKQNGWPTTDIQAGKWGGTTHFSIADEQGNAIAITSSNGEGCGYLIPGTDIMMNNMLGEAALLPNGFHSWQADTRLASMMSPTIVLDEDHEVAIVTGSGGAGRIPGVILQVLHYLLDHGLSLREAVHAPRLHLEHKVFNLEPGFANQLDGINIKEDINRWKKPTLFFGGVHTVQRTQNSYQAVGDTRRSGVVASTF